MATSVNLRKIKISKNRHSFYLDFAPPYLREDGKLIRKEYLKIHIKASPRTPFEVKDKEYKVKLATELRNKRYKEINGTSVAKEMKEAAEAKFIQRKGGLFAFIDTLQETAGQAEYTRLTAVKTYFSLYRKDSQLAEDIQINQINETVIRSFVAYMSKPELLNKWGKPMAQTSKFGVVSAFKAVIIELFNQGLLEKVTKFKFDKGRSADPVPLTQEQLISLAAINCRYPEVKKACLFTALTSLRWGDVKELKWGMIKNGWLKKVIRKTGFLYNAPLSEQAIELIGERGEDDEFIFTGLPDCATRYIEGWTARVTGEHMTHHDFRHTFGTILGGLGVRESTIRSFMHPQTVQNTTQIYIQTTESQLIEAVNLIKIK